MTPLWALRSIPSLYALVLLVLLLAANVSAQSSDNINEKVWAAVAFVNHGEKTPSLGGLQTVLTPQGAQQMSRQGSAFRNRYLIGSNSSLANSTQPPPIQNIASDAIVNSQLTILSQTDEWVAGGAMAFLQGLYPPNTQAFNSFAGGQELAQNFINNSQTNYPLGGYQYPNIQTLSTTDSSSIAIQGTVGCTAWYNMASTIEQTELVNRFTATQSFYQNLFSTAPLQGSIPIEQANYGNAYEVYEFVNYMYTHNETVSKGLQNANDTLTTLRNNAFEIERAKNSNNATSNTNDPNNVVASIAGRTLAQKITDSFSSVTQGNGSKLTLIFGSLEPMLAFFSVGGLFTRPNLLSGPFATLPEPGAAMIFELIGQDPNGGTSMPTTENLLIRFTYRASADDDAQFSVYPLFGSGFDGQSIPYTGFLSSMRRFAEDTSQWCDICQSTSASWCANSLSDSTSPPGKPGVKPAIAGVIGAVVTIAVVGIAGLVLYALGACRFGRPADSNGHSGTLGGFKGAEKMASDIDVSVSKGGVQHERIGSWELNGGNEPSTGSLGIVTADFGKDMPRPRRLDDDGISMTGVTPVKVRESV